MQDLKTILEVINPQDRDNFQVFVGTDPVCDYKTGNNYNVFLITQNNESLDALDVVTLEELRKFISQSEFPYSLVQFKSEKTQESLKELTITGNKLILN